MSRQVVAVLAGLAAASTAAGASLMAMGQVVDWSSPAGLGAVFTAVGTAIGAGLAVPGGAGGRFARALPLARGRTGHIAR